MVKHSHLCKSPISCLNTISMGGYISTSSQSFTHIIIITNNNNNNNNNKIKTEDLVECFEYLSGRQGQKASKRRLRWRKKERKIRGSNCLGWMFRIFGARDRKRRLRWDQDWKEKEFHFGIILLTTFFQFGIILLSTLFHSAQHRGESDQIDHQTTFPLETLYFSSFICNTSWLIFVIGATQVPMYSIHCIPHVSLKYSIH